jgi:hypothetical protein
MPPKIDYTERLTRIETKLDQALVHLQDHESRIRSVEKAWWKQSAIIGALIASISWFGPVLRKHIFGS